MAEWPRFDEPFQTTGVARFSWFPGAVRAAANLGDWRANREMPRLCKGGGVRYNRVRIALRTC